MHPLRIEEISVRHFRNLTKVDLQPSPRFNVVYGDNGQGKTNLLEAIYLAATSRSFRTAKPGDSVEHGAEIASVRTVLAEADERREQSVGLRAGQRLLKIDGKRPATAADYAVRTPAVLFHPGDLSLSMGGGVERRRLLDRVALYLAPGSLAETLAYTRAVRERQRALETRGVEARDLEQWEELIVRHGLSVMAARHAASLDLAASMSVAFGRIAAPDLVLTVAYEPSAPNDAESYRRELVRTRRVDVKRRGASIGPHRDDLVLRLQGHRMRMVASQGQHRAVVLALKAAEMDVIGAARSVRPILLLDDVSSELDRQRTVSLFAFLREQQGQVFLTTTRPELIEMDELPDPSSVGRVDFAVSRGVISPSDPGAGNLV
ncbi:DNA replication/repair protein RecF [Pendulispora albinea]|uniref:DNA replication and repair protein RecF n=1 Tax=Pendulispora albinea TaxID=2741071 RepID=A0ABZ2M004_9BACT